MLNLPTYDELPSREGIKGCAWGVFGENDQLGTVNLLTPEIVKSAATEIKTGQMVSLNWPMHLPLEPFFKRKKAHHFIKPRGGPRADDEIHINTQSGSQIDCLRHFGHNALGTFYNGVKPEVNKLGVPDLPHDPKLVDPADIELGVQNWANHGISGRGVLLDVWGYLVRQTGEARPYDACTSVPISLDLLNEVAQAEGIQFRHGDILLIRSGFTVRYYDSTKEEREYWGTRQQDAFAGIDQVGDDIRRFLWDNHFAMVGGDAPAFERWPPPQGEPYLHEHLLGMWGCPIAEMLDLERLAEVCSEQKRWTFFLSSWPLASYGGIASLANAGAIL